MCRKIVCPSCGNEIKLENEDFAAIVEQVRNEEFAEEVSKRVEIEKTRITESVKLAEANAKLEMQTALTAKDAEILNLNKSYEALTNKTVIAIRKKDEELTTLKISSGNEISKLQEQLRMASEKQNAAVAAAIAAEQQHSKKKDMEIARLTESLKAKESESMLAVQNANLTKDKQIDALNAKISNMEATFSAREIALKGQYAAMIRVKDEEIESYKSFKSKLSTKMVGESLEEHCMSEFARIRPLLPSATFEKDTIASESGSKGDFIFRDYDSDKNETVSIMFDAKNESDDSIRKHKNKDFLRELDKDRKEKGCEYAILISTLEPDSELYNQGIVDVSDQFPKMYVVRPQFFIPIITLLRNAALKTVEIKKELLKIKAESVDFSTFVDDLDNYKDNIGKSVEMAEKKKDTAIEKIDKTIAILQSIKDDFVKFDQHMATAKTKSEKLTVKKITSKSPAVAAAIREASALPASEEVSSDVKLDFSA